MSIIPLRSNWSNKPSILSPLPPAITVRQPLEASKIHLWSLSVMRMSAKCILHRPSEGKQYRPPLQRRSYKINCSEGSRSLRSYTTRISNNSINAKRIQLLKMAQERSRKLGAMAGPIEWMLMRLRTQETMLETWPIRCRVCPIEGLRRRNHHTKQMKHPSRRRLSSLQKSTMSNHKSLKCAASLRAKLLNKAMNPNWSE